MYKVIIVDDESIIQQGVKTLIDWNELNCTISKTCKNGREALEFIQGNDVDFVITDIKMPVMDGLELAKKITDLYEGIKVVILTAYSEFELIQRSIRKGASDFIIKNDFIEELPQTMKRLIEQKEEENKSRKEKEEKDSYLKEMLLRMLIKGNNCAPQLEKELESLKREEKNYCVCSLIAIYNEKKYSKDNILMMIKNLFKALDIEEEYYFIEIQEKEIAIVFCGNNKKEVTKEGILSICNQTLRMAEEFMRMIIKIGVSDVVYALDLLSLAWGQAMTARNQAWTGENEVIGYISEINSIEINCKKRYHEMWTCLIEGNLPNAIQLLKATAEQLSQIQYPIDKLKISVFNFISIAYRHLNSNYYDEDTEENEQQTFLAIERATTAYQVYDGVEKMMIYVDNVMKSKHEKHYLVKLIDKYIAENYKNSFTIAEMANDLEVSSGYISRIYKQKTGKTIIETINRYRVEKAKTFLKDTTMKIYEVAEAVGIEDPAYFTTVFIKYTGINPSEFRSR